jgi:hypothetical protein
MYQYFTNAYKDKNTMNESFTYTWPTELGVKIYEEYRMVRNYVHSTVKVLKKVQNKAMTDMI